MQCDCPFSSLLAPWFSTTPSLLVLWYYSRFAAPLDVTGDQIYTVPRHSTLEYDSLLPPADAFTAWLQQLPPAEHGLMALVYFLEFDGETLLAQYLQLPCTLYIGTNGGKKHHKAPSLGSSAPPRSQSIGSKRSQAPSMAGASARAVFAARKWR